MLGQGVKVKTLGRQNERNNSYVWLVHTSIFGLCFMPVCLMKSNCYSFIYSSLVQSNPFDVSPIFGCNFPSLIVSPQLLMVAPNLEF